MSKILIIEDESALQKTVGDMLIKSGYEVVSALDGETGLQMAQTEKLDLIILDLILPKMSGFEVLEKLKDNSKTKEVPVLILTNLESMEDVKKTLQGGAISYLIKEQYTLDEVLQKVKQVIKK